MPTINKLGFLFPLLMKPGVNFINILCSLFCQYPFAKNSQSQTVTREKLRKALSYKKCVHKMLMKLTSDVLYEYQRGSKIEIAFETQTKHPN